MAPFGENQLVAMAMVHCTLQGVSIPLLVSFLNSQRTERGWFKAYVLWVNLVSAVQTVVHIIQAVDVMNSEVPGISLAFAAPLLTNLIGASVQGFFIHRCWRIFQQRLLPILPFLALCLTTLICGLMSAYFVGTNSQAHAGKIVCVSLFCFLNESYQGAKRRGMIVTIWMFSVFLLELGMTSTTIIYLYRSRTGVREHDGIFSTIWQVMWASAAPPMLLMIVPILDQFLNMTPDTYSATLIPIAMSGKFFVLSLMITLVGRGYIREKLEKSDNPSPIPSFSPNQRGTISVPVFAHPNSATYELQTRTDAASPQASTLTPDFSQIELGGNDVYAHKHSSFAICKSRSSDIGLDTRCILESISLRSNCKFRRTTASIPSAVGRLEYNYPLIP